MQCWFSLYDKFGKHRTFTTARSDATGYTADETPDFAELVHPGDRTRHAEWLVDGRYVNSTLVYRIVRRDGSSMWVRSYMGVFSNGDICSLTVKLPPVHVFFFMVAALLDRASLTDFELRFAVSKHNKAGSFVDISGSYHQIVRSPLDMLERSDIYKKLIHPDHRQRVYQESHVRTDGSIPEVIFKMRRSDGGYSWVKMYSTMMYADNLYAVTVRVYLVTVLVTKLMRALGLSDTRC